MMEEKNSTCDEENDDNSYEYNTNSSSSYKDKVFVIAFEDLPENYESKKSKKQLKEIFESIRFI